MGDPGSGKSPGLDLAAAPVRALQEAAWAAYREELDRWEAAGGTGRKPTLDDLYTGDATLEALTKSLESSPGLAILRDELAGWAASMDAYRKGGDREAWLTLWTGSPLKVDRKTSGTSFVPAPVVCLAGGVQPAKLGALLGGGVRDGLPDRFLIAVPDPVTRRWTEAEVDPSLVRAATDRFRRLRSLSDPVETALDPAARGLFAAWFNENADAAAEATGIEQGWLVKGPSFVARLALVLHAAWEPERVSDPIGPGMVDDAIRLVAYFGAHLKRALALLGTAPATLDERVLRRLREAGTAGLTRDPLLRALGGHVAAADLTAALGRLQTAGRAEPVPFKRESGKGGRPPEEWRVVG